MKIANLAKQVGLVLGWWVAIAMSSGIAYALVAALANRTALIDYQALGELLLGSLMVSAGGVAGRIIWGSRSRAEDWERATSLEIPASTSADLKIGSTGAYSVGALTLVVGLYAFLQYSATQLPGANHAVIFTGLTVLFLGYGVYRKSRTCAILVLLTFLFGTLSKIEDMLDGRHLTLNVGVAAMTSAVVLYFYIRGIRGTFRYQALLRREATSRIPLT